MQGHQTAGAGCVNGHTRALEVKEPANSVRKDCIGHSGGLVLDGRLRVRIEYSQVVVIEPADKHRGVGSHRISHGNPGVLECMIHILHHQPLLWVERQELILGDVEEGPVEIGVILGEEMTSLYMELNDGQHSYPTTL